MGWFTRICIKKNFPTLTVESIGTFVSLIMAREDASSPKSLALDFHLLGKPLMAVRKRSVLEMEHLGTPARNGLQNEVFHSKEPLR